MNKVLGITGGIGSGKTTVVQMFKEIGVPVYNADTEAKKLMQSSHEIKNEICSVVGQDAYKNGILDKDFISDKIFNDKNILKKINNIIHPEVSKHFKQWLSFQKSSYVVKEVAILFESKIEDQFDFILTVTAPENLRIQRVIKRDKKSLIAIQSIISNQLKDSVKIKNSDFVISNINMDKTLKNVYDIHKKIINSIGKK